MVFHQLIDMTGKEIGYWTVIERTNPPEHVCDKIKKQAWWLCKCKCGLIKTIHGASLRAGKSNSCGCYGHKKNSVQANNIIKFPRHHGLKNHELYNIWDHLLLKCYHIGDQHYKNYGALGFSVCDEWRHAPNFIKWSVENEWKKGFSLEIKIDEKEFNSTNCFWIEKGNKISSMKRRNGRSNFRNLKGNIFGSLTVISDEISFIVGGNKRNGYLCKCICGNEKNYTPSDLRIKNINSCGCRGKKFDWSIKYEYCQECKKTDFKYCSKGICRGCYMKKYNKEYEIKNKEKSNEQPSTNFRNEYLNESRNTE